MTSIVATKRYSVYAIGTNGSGNTSEAPKPERANVEEAFTRNTIVDDVEVKIDFLVLRLTQSCFVWCGLSSGVPRLETLSVGMMLDKTKPVSTSILLQTQPSALDDEGSALRIAKRASLKAVHFASSLGVDAGHSLRMFAEKIIIEHLTK